MIPSTNQRLLTEMELEEQPSRNYYMNLKDSISGTVDNLDAMRQVVYKILNTERYQYLIYSWNYGVELLDLFGEPVTYVCPEI